MSISQRHTRDALALSPCIDLDALEAKLEELQRRYAPALPFPHIALDDFLLSETVRRAMAEFPPIDREHWINYVHGNERKFSNTDPAMWPPVLQAVWRELTAPRFVRFLSDLTGIDGLMTDDTLEGAGLHQTLPGGFLNVHADFTVHPLKRHWRRRCNLILYLNDNWLPEYGGELELWSRDMKTRVEVIPPIGNRAVVFTTGVDTWHGHPDPLRCPPGRARQSLALYYYTHEESPLTRSTEYRARPGDGARALVIYADKQAVRAYDWVKRRVGLSDKSTAARFLGGRANKPPPHDTGK